MKHNLCENNNSLLTSELRPSFSDLEINLKFRDGVPVSRYNSFPTEFACAGVINWAPL